MVQLSHPYMTAGKTITLAIWTFVGKMMSLVFYTLSGLIMALLPPLTRSKSLLIDSINITHQSGTVFTKDESTLI